MHIFASCDVTSVCQGTLSGSVALFLLRSRQRKRDWQFVTTDLETEPQNPEQVFSAISSCSVPNFYGTPEDYSWHTNMPHHSSYIVNPRPFLPFVCSTFTCTHRFPTSKDKRNRFHIGFHPTAERKIAWGRQLWANKWQECKKLCKPGLLQFPAKTERCPSSVEGHLTKAGNRCWPKMHCSHWLQRLSIMLGQRAWESMSAKENTWLKIGLY